tara:strand:+ start:904 stop:1209 length:306 start_codon:yes stop_codon:yes gene_type:complete
MELEGKLEAKYETKKFQSGFKKREFVINTGGDYPQTIKLEAHKDNIDKLDGISVGDFIKCSININGRLWEGTYYNNIVAWKIDAGASPKKVQVDEDEGLPF